MNSSRCANIRIKRLKTWTTNSEISEKISKIMLMMQHEMKKLLSSLTQIRVIRMLIDQHHVHDLKSLNSNLNRILVQSLNHRHSKIKWIRSIATIAENLIISFAIVINLERWIQTASYEKWMCMKRMIHRVRRIISRSSREKNNLCYSRCRDRWDENSENWCLQLRRQSLRW